MDFFPFALFDLDGTLVDSMPYWQNCGVEYLLARGITPEPGLWDDLKLMSTVECAHYFQQRYGIPDDAKTIVEDNNRIMFKHYRQDVPAKPGVDAYLRTLRANGVQLGICSATSVALVDMVLTRLGMRDCFTTITSCDEVGLGKDRPEVFRLALSRQGANPSQCVMFEDSDFAVHTAKALGMRVAGVYDAACHSTPEVMEKLCDWYIRDFTRTEELPRLSAK